ncbi:MAG: cytochrome C oxidase subunit IV family protein [Chloroflexota bacterium]
MTEHSPTSTKSRKTAAFGLGVRIFVWLAILTGVEFGVSLATDGSATLLLIMAVAKVALIVYYFMHIYSLWREEGH